MTQHCLDLFAGLGGFSAAFEDADGWEVTTVDIEGRFEPDICADVMELRPSDLPDADVILASPPCNTFSKAAAWHGHHDDNGPQTDLAKGHVALVFHTMGLIEALSPDFWFLENPEGHLSKYLGEPTGRVTYCRYGKPHRKPTNLWGDHPPMTYRRCANGDDCHASKPRRESAGDDNHPAREMDSTPAERARVPRELSEAILHSAEGVGQQSGLGVFADA